MNDKIIGFIGAGNMGSAMIHGLTDSGLIAPDHLIASAHSDATLKRLQASFHIKTTLSNETVAKESDILFLAVKPNKLFLSFAICDVPQALSCIPKAAKNIPFTLYFCSAL